MEVKFWIEPLEQDVAFTATLTEVNGSSRRLYCPTPSTIKNASLTIDNLQWDEAMFSKEENLIIEKYLPVAEIELFAEARRELMDALEV